MKLFTRNKIEPVPVVLGGFEYLVHPDVAGTIAGLRAQVEDLNTEAEQTALAAVAMHRRQQETIDKLRATKSSFALRLENGALKDDLGTARDRIRQLERDLAAERITVEDLRAQQRRAVEHLRVCERAQAVADHDLDKARSNAS